MTKDYQSIHNSKLEEMKQKVFNSSINDKLALKAISNSKINNIINKINNIIAPKQVWEDFNFRTGKILGILRSIAQNPTKRKELLEVTGLTQDYIDIYFQVCGNLPFLNITDNTINYGRPMLIEETKEFISLVSLQFEYVIEEEDLFDITKERWDRLYKNALDRIEETIKHNNEYQITTYEE